MMINKIRENYNEQLHLIFRVLIGFLFFLHGVGKMPGIFDGSTPLISLIGLAGVIEFIGGIAIFLGLFTRPVAVLTAVEMAVAYIKVHAPRGINPLSNGGETAVLYFAAFVALIAFGAGKFSLDWVLKRRERNQREFTI